MKENIILYKSPLNIDTYRVADLKPETLYSDKRYNVNEDLQDASRIQKKSWKLSSMDTITDRGLLNDLKMAPFSFNNIRQSELENTFGIPLLSTVETTQNEGNVIELQHNLCSINNQMSYNGSQHQEKLEGLISGYQGLRNYSENELKVYQQTMKYYSKSSYYYYRCK